MQCVFANGSYDLTNIWSWIWYHFIWSLRILMVSSQILFFLVNISIGHCKVKAVSVGCHWRCHWRRRSFLSTCLLLHSSTRKLFAIYLTWCMIKLTQLRTLSCSIKADRSIIWPSLLMGIEFKFVDSLNIDWRVPLFNYAYMRLLKFNFNGPIPDVVHLWLLCKVLNW